MPSSDPVVRRPVRVTVLLAAAFTLLAWGCFPFMATESGRFNRVGFVIAAPVFASVFAWLAVGFGLASQRPWAWRVLWLLMLSHLALFTGLAVLLFACRHFATQVTVRSIGDLDWLWWLLRVLLWIWALAAGAACLTAAAGWAGYLRRRDG